MSSNFIDNPSLLRGASAARVLVLVVALGAVSQPALIRAAVDQIVPASVSAELGAGAHAEFPQAENRHISDDGRFVAFTSFGTNLVPGQVDTNGRRDVFLYDRELDSVQMVSHSTAGLVTTNSFESGDTSVWSNSVP